MKSGEVDKVVEHYIDCIVEHTVNKETGELQETERPREAGEEMDLQKTNRLRQGKDRRLRLTP